jgi:hypothetical protein
MMARMSSSLPAVAGLVRLVRRSAEELQMLKTLHNGAHNTAVDQEQAVADQLNEQVRVFKAKHPGP